MPTPQPAILHPIPQQSRYISYTLIPGADPQMATQGIDIPSTPAALWLWLRGSGMLLKRHRQLDLTAVGL